MELGDGDGRVLPATEPETAGPTSGGGITAIAQVPTLLELHPISYDIEAMVRALVPLWPGHEEERVTLREVLASIPAPDDAIRRAMRRAMAIHACGGVYRPGKEILLRAWRECVQQAAIEGTTAPRREHFVRKDDEDMDRDVDAETEAVEDAKRAIWDCEDLRPTHTTESEAGLDPRKTTRWAGTLLLACRATGHGMGRKLRVESFLAEWRNTYLPEAWNRAAAANFGLELLDPQAYRVVVVEDGPAQCARHVVWAGADEDDDDMHSVLALARSDRTGEEAGAPHHTPVAAAATKNRKWHEKFKESRRVI